MLYEKSKGEISEELFKNPPCEFRGAPFWAWNGKLEPEEISWQTKVFKDMGFGGYHMHVRTGLTDEYLGETFNKNIATCVQSSIDNDMLAWLYDEDRWPSGSAGGIVTRDYAFRQRYVYFSNKKLNDAPKFNNDGVLISGSKLLACYSVHLFCGKLRSYKRVSENENANRYAYLKIVDPETWYNNNTYVDTMNKKAIDAFAELTYKTYADTLGDNMGTTCPAIFTDEPQVYKADVMRRAWTDDFADTYKAKYGDDILDTLPELFYSLSGNKLSTTRYRYFDHVAERFAEAFADNLGKKAEEYGVKLTGHMMCENGWHGQTAFLGECMRHYRGFGLPGIDMLCSNYEYITAKQCQSAVCQYGKEGMLSELYGVSRWNYDFRMYKLHGDWQAALGVTIRVPHLSMMTMKGEAKRDYPASIFYQSPWYKKYNVVEDHFARVNTALTNGKQICEVAVIHPIESFWYIFGNDRPLARYHSYRNEQHLPKWLLRGGIDFQYISESLFPELCEKGSNPLSVGEMKYKVVIIPEMTTIRSTTLERLSAFIEQGGKLIVMGKMPTCMDGIPSDKPKQILAAATKIPFKQKELLAEVECARIVGIYDAKTGKHTDNLIYALKEKADGRWLFISRANHNSFPNHDVIKNTSLKIVVDGEWQPKLWNTLDGTVSDIPFEAKNGKTEIYTSVYDQDSLLIRLENTGVKSFKLPEEKPCKKNIVIAKDNVPFKLDEENVVLLDRAKFALDDQPYSLCEKEILTLDNVCRKKLDFPAHGGQICQPWAAEKKPADHKIRLCFTIPSKIDYQTPTVALEDADVAEIIWNGKPVDKKIDGWYVDKSIKKVALPPLKKGKNVLEIILPFGENTDTEWCYLLGNFGVKVNGTKKTVIEMPKSLYYGPIRKQGLPFYGGTLTYLTSFEGNGKDAIVQVPSFRSAMVEIECCGTNHDLAYSPYAATTPTQNGETPLSIKTYVSRENAFGPVHNRAHRANNFTYGPSGYRGNIFKQANCYILVDEGILTPPIITLEK